MEDKEFEKIMLWLEKTNIIKRSGKKSTFFDTRKFEITSFGKKLISLDKQPKYIPIKSKKAA
ncbi:MAG: hypothetical protein KDD56_10740 [Bdellovibrionales bacterium]|nr:hypothetical protein [Bdellovibrionales bacterium]